MNPPPDQPASSSATAAQTVDEDRHEPGPEALWSESWYFDFFDESASLGGYVRLGMYPHQNVCWYWACLVGPGRQLVTVIDHEVPIPPVPSLEVRAEGLWADHTVETPLDHMSLGNESFALGLEDPAGVYDGSFGERVPFGLDLEWETDGGTFAYPGVTRYEVPCRVHGIVLVGAEEIGFEGWGQRDHSWGERDWWTLGWQWTAGRLDDGSRFHATEVRLGDDSLYATGYVQPGDEPLQPVGVGTDRPISRSQQLGGHGFPLHGHTEIGELALDIEPVSFSPVLLTAPDGRVSRFPRALCRFREVDGAGRCGVGWTEWNQPQA